ncbi:hypothetical protein GQX74_011155 [Glossina fuscipes]|nr:hypothetical protein GQX74_011155 [Glossina fuscipes]
MYNLSEDILKDPDLPKNQERLSGNVGKDVTIKSKEVPNSFWFLREKHFTVVLFSNSPNVTIFSHADSASYHEMQGAGICIVFGFIVEFITRCEICDITAVGIPAILARSSPITSALIDIPHYVRVWPSSENQECGLSQTTAERDTQPEPAAGATYINCTSVFGKASASELFLCISYVIFGPPGTGKTATLLKTILQIFKLIPSERLLVGTPSNSSADLITTCLIESAVLKIGDLIRVVSHKEFKEEPISAHLWPYCAMGDKYWDTGVDDNSEDDIIVNKSGHKLRCQRRFLGHHRLIIGTCDTLGNFLEMRFQPNHFAHLLIDEASQCTEPEMMLAVAQVSRERGRRILSRPPYLRNDDDRFPLHVVLTRLVTNLLYNYRALPSIVNAYNELLIPTIRENSSEAEMLKQLDHLLPQSPKRPEAFGIFFHGIRSEDMKKKTLAVVDLYRKPQPIGITPYIKQVEHLRELFFDADVAMPKIGTVEEFQGEFHMID